MKKAPLKNDVAVITMWKKFNFDPKNKMGIGILGDFKPAGKVHSDQIS